MLEHRLRCLRLSVRALIALLALMILATAGPALAEFNEGWAAYKRGDYVTALHEWRPLAEQGHAKAQANLGLMYEYGRGVPQNYVRALRWYRLAAEQGDAIALMNLGVMYDQGRGVPRNYLLAHIWSSLAVARLPPGSARDLAASTRDIIERRMTPAEIVEARRLAEEWTERHEAK
jgi:TPR repeat protein